MTGLSPSEVWFLAFVFTALAGIVLTVALLQQREQRINAETALANQAESRRIEAAMDAHHDRVIGVAHEITRGGR